MLVLADRVQQTATSIGAATFAFASVEVGYRSFLSAIGVGNNTFYTAWAGGDAWEVGVGTVQLDGSLSRDAILSSGTGGAKIFFNSVPVVWCDIPAAKTIALDANGALTYGGVTLSPAVTGTGAMALSASPTFTGTVHGAALSLTGNATFADAGIWGASGISGVTKLGIGMSPTNILDITQNQNAPSAIGLLNNNSGATAQCLIGLTNGTHSLEIHKYGTGFTTTGVQRQDGSLIQESGGGGLTLNTSAAQPIYFCTNNAQAGQFTAAGHLLVGSTSIAGSLSSPTGIMSGFFRTWAQNTSVPTGGTTVIQFSGMAGQSAYLLTGYGAGTNGVCTALAATVTGDNNVANATAQLCRGIYSGGTVSAAFRNFGNAGDFSFGNADGAECVVTNTSGASITFSLVALRIA